MKKTMALLLSPLVFLSSFCAALPLGGRPGVARAAGAPERSALSLPASAVVGRAAVPAPFGSDRDGIAPSQGPALSLPAGVSLDSKPAANYAEAVRTQAFHNSPDGTKPEAPIELDADPTDMTAIEEAVRALVDTHPEQFGAPSAQMVKVSVQAAIVPGEDHRSILAVFRQYLEGVDIDGRPYTLPVGGGSLAFHIKVFPGRKPLIMGMDGRLFPGISADIMSVQFTEEQLLDLAKQRIQSSLPGPDDPALPAPQLAGRSITNRFDGWRAVNVYRTADLQGAPLLVGVDVKSGEVFFWNPSSTRISGVPIQSKITGAVFGRGTTLSPDGNERGPIGPIALPFTNIFDAEDGETVVAVTDVNGHFTLEGGADDSRSRTLMVRLSSPFLPSVTDADATNLAPEASFTATPGEPVTVTLNADSDDPAVGAGIVAYTSVMQHFAFMRSLPGLGDDPRITIPLSDLIVNRPEEPGGGAYNRVTNAIRLAAAGIIWLTAPDGSTYPQSVASTAEQSVVFHEATHKAVAAFAHVNPPDAAQHAEKHRYLLMSVLNALMGPSVNESLADFVSSIMRNNPIQGPGFYEDPPEGQPSYIRSNVGSTLYDPEAEPHNGVVAQVLWALRAAFITTRGEEDGNTFAKAMISLLLIAQPLDAISALHHVLVWLMGSDGGGQFVEALHAIAREHGIELLLVTVAPPDPPAN